LKIYSGSKVTPWNLLQLFDSSRAFSFWTVAHAERPSESFLDARKLLENNLFFIATANLEMNPELYNYSKPKYPLLVTKELDYVGTSSMNITSYLQQSDLKFPYAICKVQTVLANSKTRKPTPFPDWWRKKYETSAIGGTSLKMKPLPEVENVDVHHCPMTVFDRDTDSYNHTNWTSYIRYCADACSLMAMKNLYKNVDRQTINNGCKQVEISFRKESVLGDILDVVSWEHSNESNTINFKVKKGDDTCTEATVTFFDSELTSRL